MIKEKFLHFEISKKLEPVLLTDYWQVEVTFKDSNNKTLELVEKRYFLTEKEALDFQRNYRLNKGGK